MRQFVDGVGRRLGRRLSRSWPALFGLWFACSTAAAAADPIVIQMYGGYDKGSNAYEITAKYLRMYEQLHPNIKIVDLGREHDTDKLAAMFAAGTAPDVIEQDVTIMANYYQLGLLAPVPPQLQHQLEQALFPISVRSAMVGGTMVSVPNESEGTGLWYSKAALDAGGVAGPPWTVEQVEQIAKRLSKTEAGKLITPGLVQSGDALWALDQMGIAMLFSDGGRIVDDEGELALDGTPLRTTIDRMVAWFKAGFWGFTWDGYTQFTHGDVPLGFGYPWWLGDIKSGYQGDYKANFGVTLLPGSAGYGAMHYGHGYGVNKNSQHLQEVFDLLGWLSLERIGDSTPIGERLTAIGSLPINRGDVSSRFYAPDVQIYQAFLDNMAYARTTTEWAQYGAGATIGATARRIVTDGVNPETAIAEMVQSVKNDMQKYQEAMAARAKTS